MSRFKCTYPGLKSGTYEEFRLCQVRVVTERFIGSARGADVTSQLTNRYFPYLQKRTQANFNAIPPFRPTYTQLSSFHFVSELVQIRANWSRENIAVKSSPSLLHALKKYFVLISGSMNAE